MLFIMLAYLTQAYFVIYCYFVVGNHHNDSCRYSPSSSPNVITVGTIQEASDHVQQKKLALLKGGFSGGAWGAEALSLQIFTLC